MFCAKEATQNCDGFFKQANHCGRIRQRHVGGIVVRPFARFKVSASPRPFRWRRPASRRIVESLAQHFGIATSICIEMGHQLYVLGRRVALNDVALHKFESSLLVGEVQFHVTVDGEHYSCISRWELVQVMERKVKCIIRTDPVLVASGQVVESCIHSVAAVGEISYVLLPLGLHTPSRLG